MKRSISILLLLVSYSVALAYTIPWGKGQLRVTTVARNAVRIQYTEASSPQSVLPDWLYVKHDTVSQADITVNTDKEQQTLTVNDKEGRAVFTAFNHQMRGSEATLTILSPADEYLFGLGQFQDGYTNVRGLSRRLTQVNTQSSIPMVLSSKGYGVLWNNYGMTEFNPCRQQVSLQPALSGDTETEIVNITTTEGGRQERREHHVFEGTIDVAEAGTYSLLLDVGQKMARRHHLCIDGKPVIDIQNLWLPPTVSCIVELTAGRHTLTAELSKGDTPTLFYDKVDNTTVFRSPEATAVDYTVFIGSPDEIIDTYRELTGPSPLMPQWALGYIHCRERFHSSDEILQTAQRFRSEQLPVDVMVQDWQYWGKYGWNSMRFDETYYPNPKALTDSLHQMNMRLMVSVWSKIDKQSEVGRQMLDQHYYIDGTDWIDFFNPEAAAAYWHHFSTRLVPLGIDAWWQDATEPENDDLVGRRVNGGKWRGELVRNVYPLLVNKTVYEGLMNAGAEANSTLYTLNSKLYTLNSTLKRPMILTRCGFPGIQRYGSALWSGDVGNDWQALRLQITAGLGVQAAGIPWWTYDAGGFFRPQDQYKNPDFIERMLRWIETSVYLPLMRVHGYMSNTEPWNYGKEAQQVIANCLNERYRLLPYIYSQAAAIAFEGSTLMRPLVFDFAHDTRALQTTCNYMFGKALLISPVTSPHCTQWQTYLPQTAGGWYDYHTGTHYAGQQMVTTAVDHRRIPVFVKAGSIVPMATAPHQYASAYDSLDIRIYPGADAQFTLYEDDGQTFAYEQGQCSRIAFQWNDARREFIISPREGHYPSMIKRRPFRLLLPDGTQRTVTYSGKKIKIKI